MADVKRICECCKSNRTNYNEGLVGAVDFRGHIFALIGSCCEEKIAAMLEKLYVKYGGYIENGTKMCSPYGSPTIQSIAHLEREIA